MRTVRFTTVLPKDLVKGDKGEVTFVLKDKVITINKKMYQFDLPVTVEKGYLTEGNEIFIEFCLPENFQETLIVASPDYSMYSKEYLNNTLWENQTGTGTKTTKNGTKARNWNSALREILRTINPNL